MATKEVVSKVSEPSVTLLIQQCNSAKLQIKPCSVEGAGDEECVNIGKGVVVYVSFLKSATIESVHKAANIALSVKLSYDEATSKLQSALETNSDVLIVPQACLGGKLKGKAFQYHNLLAKEHSQALYQTYIDQTKQLMVANSSKGSLQHGTYGIKQILSFESSGPYTHILDI
eukprot:TRINITY_DN3929_c0_g1_i1.p1 TRINITY_DN3929_c0_g1~~TRINITY_DN3929_c0_g1_i1.p1  ORF type:complete len:182 (+),score=36.09 TRINITY_DN3929_c0_g1_i1:29-547(+)